MASSQEWVQLQRKIFSRWCKQKLIRRHDVKVGDIVEDLKDGAVLFALVEELSESKFPGQAPKQGTVKGRIKQIEAVGNALKFVWSKGVELRLKPSAEQIVDGDEAAALALVFAIMMKFMKIGDDEESQKLNAKDALLLWCQNKCMGLEKVPAIESFKKTSKAPFHGGAALCGIIHKHRPALVPPGATWNVELAQNAALEYFNLEKFITPAEVAKLDENSMIVFVSEFYYGIMEQRKIDLAARRITKLIKLTKENDRLKAEYNKTAAEYKERLTKVEKILGDRTIDDTMAGAKRKLEEFYKYKSDDKNMLLAAQLSLESLYNNLAMRLAHHKRPEFVPPAGVTLKDVEAALKHLEQVEQERSVALHAELNRQVKLVEVNGQHTTLFENLKAWGAEKDAFLRKKEIIESVSAAQLHLRLLDAFDKECEAARATNMRKLQDMGKYLASERYEHIAAVREREAAMSATFETLTNLSKAKRPVLEDDLAREVHKEKVRLMFRQHTEKFEALLKWVNESAAYLTARELILSTAEAHTQLSLLSAFEQEKVSMADTAVAELKKLGVDVVEAKYKTQYSEWAFEHPEELASRAKRADDEWTRLAELSAEKKRVLDDHRAREDVHEKTLVVFQQHTDRYQSLERFIAAKETYLTTFPVIHDTATALVQLGLFQSYEAENALTRQTQVVELLAQGQTIRGASHSSQYSSFKWHCVKTLQPPYEKDIPADAELINTREKFVLDKWDKLAELAKEFKAVLDDALAREEYAAKARIVARTHNDKYEQLAEYITKTEAYLRAREHVHSVAEAKACMTTVEGVEKEWKRQTEIHVVEFAKIGADVLARKYDTPLSKYAYDESDTQKPVTHFGTREARDAVEAHLSFVQKKVVELTELLARKKQVVQDAIDNEAYREESMKLAGQHADGFAKYMKWAEAKEKYLRARERVTCIADATTQIALLDAFNAEHEVTRGGEVAGLTALGAELLGRSRKTDLSSYTYEHTTYAEPEFDEDKPELRTLVQEHERIVLENWTMLGNLSKEKARILQLHLDREQFALQTRTLAQQHEDMYGRIVAWAELRMAFLKARETIDSISLAQTHITLLDQFESEWKSMTDTLCAEFKKLGANILAAKHENEIGTYVYEKTAYTQPDCLVDVPEKRATLEAHLKDIDDRWAALGVENKTRRQLLDDHLARETFAHEVRLLEHQHEKLAGKVLAWCGAKKVYLAARPAIDSVSEANTQIAIAEGYDKEVQSMEATSVSSLSKLQDTILPKKYHTELSSWEPENPDEIKARLMAIREDLTEMATLREKLRADLDASLKLEMEKERLRLEYAHEALEFTKFAKDASANLAIETFGFNLEEVTAYKATITASREKLIGDADKAIGAIRAVFEEGVKLGVRENIYTTITLANIDETKAALVRAIDTRDAAYEKELARQIANDNLCKKFAGLVDPFSQSIIALKDQISQSKADLDTQLTFVNKKISELPQFAKGLEPIAALDKEMEQAGITDIRHTTLTFKDVEVQMSQLGKFLETKRSMLEHEIENAKLKGITPEQFKEIELNFHQFDKDKSGDIDRKELAACMYSLGEEKSNKELADIMAEFGKDGKIKYEGFKELMIRLLGDSDTKQEVLNGFELINRSDKVAVLKEMLKVQPPEDVEYIKQTATPCEGGYDFVAWVESMFSR